MTRSAPGARAASETGTGQLARRLREPRPSEGLRGSERWGPSLRFSPRHSGRRHWKEQVHFFTCKPIPRYGTCTFTFEQEQGVTLLKDRWDPTLTPMPECTVQPGVLLTLTLTLGIGVLPSDVRRCACWELLGSRVLDTVDIVSVHRSSGVSGGKRGAAGVRA